MEDASAEEVIMICIACQKKAVIETMRRRF